MQPFPLSQVSSRPLFPGDGHVLLLSSGLLDLLAPASVAILAQQFDAREIKVLLDAVADRCSGPDQAASVR